jgi:DNA-binding NtrC family response regulator
MDRLVRYHWPGNVRELANTIERAVVLCAGETITAADLALPETHSTCRFPDPLPAGEGDGFHEQTNAYRRQVLLSALRRANGNHTQAAKLLGLHRTYFLRLLQKLNVREDVEKEARTPPPDAEPSTPATSDKP